MIFWAEAHDNHKLLFDKGEKYGHSSFFQKELGFQTGLLCVRVSHSLAVCRHVWKQELVFTLKDEQKKVKVLRYLAAS